MIIQMKTKRRWILSILETVGDATDTRVLARATVRQTSGRTMVAGQKGFAMRLKTATRQVSGRLALNLRRFSPAALPAR